MEPIFESITITISKKEYAELIQKAFAYDVYRRKVKADAERDWGVSEIERSLFLNDEEAEMQVLAAEKKFQKSRAELLKKEEPEELFTEEELEKIAELAEE